MFLANKNEDNHHRGSAFNLFKQKHHQSLIFPHLFKNKQDEQNCNDENEMTFEEANLEHNKEFLRILNHHQNFDLLGTSSLPSSMSQIHIMPTLKCNKYFESPISQSQIQYDCSAPIARNTPENNQVKLLDYRNTKIASFCVDGKQLICLPQAFEIFLKNLVGGLHTVYTKLKRLDIVPVVCNVEQVRVLRGLGAIQPGVNRCKLIAPNEFDTLYDDCTNSGSRPGRPPKRVLHNEIENESAISANIELNTSNSNHIKKLSSIIHDSDLSIKMDNDNNISNISNNNNNVNGSTTFSLSSNASSSSNPSSPFSISVNSSNRSTNALLDDQTQIPYTNTNKENAENSKKNINAENNIQLTELLNMDLHCNIPKINQIPFSSNQNLSSTNRIISYSNNSNNKYTYDDGNYGYYYSSLNNHLKQLSNVSTSLSTVGSSNLAPNSLNQHLATAAAFALYGSLFQPGNSMTTTQSPNFYFHQNKNITHQSQNFNFDTNEPEIHHQTCLLNNISKNDTRNIQNNNKFSVVRNSSFEFQGQTSDSEFLSLFANDSRESKNLSINSKFLSGKSLNQLESKKTCDFEVNENVNDESQHETFSDEENEEVNINKKQSEDEIGYIENKNDNERNSTNQNENSRFNFDDKIKTKPKNNDYSCKNLINSNNLNQKKKIKPKKTKNSNSGLLISTNFNQDLKQENFKNNNVKNEDRKNDLKKCDEKIFIDTSPCIYISSPTSLNTSSSASSSSSSCRSSPLSLLSNASTKRRTEFTECLNNYLNSSLFKHSINHQIINKQKLKKKLLNPLSIENLIGENKNKNQISNHIKTNKQTDFYETIKSKIQIEKNSNNSTNEKDNGYQRNNYLCIEAILDSIQNLKSNISNLEQNLQKNIDSFETSLEIERKLKTEYKSRFNNMLRLKKNLSYKLKIERSVNQKSKMKKLKFYLKKKKIDAVNNQINQELKNEKSC